RTWNPPIAARAGFPNPEQQSCRQIFRQSLVTRLKPVSSRRGLAATLRSARILIPASHRNRLSNAALSLVALQKAKFAIATTRSHACETRMLRNVHLLVWR